MLGERLEAASAVVDQLVSFPKHIERDDGKLDPLGESNGTCRARSGSDQGMVALLSLHAGSP